MDFHCRAVTAVIGNCVDGMRRLCPAEYPVGFVGTHVDTAVAHLCAKIFMPVGAMKRVANGREERRPGYSGKHVSAFIGGYVASLTNAKVTVSHVLGRDFIQNIEFAIRRCCGYSLLACSSAAANTRGNIGLENRFSIFVSDQCLR